MWDRKYLLSIKELKSELEQQGLNAPLSVQALEKLDVHRKEKVLNIGNVGKRAESIGAGLLLQLGLQEYCAYEQNGLTYGRRIGATATEEWQGVVKNECEDACMLKILSPSEILQRLNVPVEVTYRYGEKGKPYFENIPLYFSISHSGDYVFCVFSTQEIGADIQGQKPMQRNALQRNAVQDKCVGEDARHENVQKEAMWEERMVQRFFSPEEKAAWERCTNPDERVKLFYRLWTRKEASGKLMGKGIVEMVGVDTESLDVCFEEYEFGNNYWLAISKEKSECEIVIDRENETQKESST